MGGLTEGFAMAAMELITLRRGGQLHRLQLHGLPDPDRVGDAAVRARRDGDARRRTTRSARRAWASRPPSARRPRSSTRSSTRSRTSGVRNLEMPVTSDKVWQALQRGRAWRSDRARRPRCARPSSRPRGGRSRSRPSSPSSRPASTRRGDRALVTRRRRLAGWVGGACSEPIVVREALRALADGEPRLVRIGPPGRGGRRAGRRRRRDEHVRVGGHGRGARRAAAARPAARRARRRPGGADARASWRRTIGWRVDRRARARTPTRSSSRRWATATRTRSRPRSRAAPATSASSRARARAASCSTASARAGSTRRRSPGSAARPASTSAPRRQPEIAVAILAELVAWRHLGSAQRGAPRRGRRPGLRDDGRARRRRRRPPSTTGSTYAFCSAHCRHRFEADPARFVPASDLKREGGRVETHRASPSTAPGTSRRSSRGSCWSTSSASSWG